METDWQNYKIIRPKKSWAKNDMKGNGNKKCEAHLKAECARLDGGTILETERLYFISGAIREFGLLRYLRTRRTK